MSTLKNYRLEVTKKNINDDPVYYVTKLIKKLLAQTGKPAVSYKDLCLKVRIKERGLLTDALDKLIDDGVFVISGEDREGYALISKAKEPQTLGPRPGVFEGTGQETTQPAPSPIHEGFPAGPIHEGLPVDPVYGHRIIADVNKVPDSQVEIEKKVEKPLDNV